mmetsp:Transcript_23323/g.28072  ORF Transcript_23323/g.28072 Transcript_23323/m.28072 type:complete len:251 (+) Transcript_23323:24-776(+)
MTEEMPCKEMVFDEEKSLGVVFDVDGTLIKEPTRDDCHGIQIRPGAAEFIQWLASRGHCVSIWTKSSKFWANRVVKKVCPLVYGTHDCPGITCRKTFSFVWCDDMLRIQQMPSLQWYCRDIASSGDECKWCEAYSSTCHQCECMWNYECPCRFIKDLRKVWYSSDDETKGFAKDRTLLIEDTPQNCRYNYGNAIYVPTYKGCTEDEEKEPIFSRMQSFFEREIEPSENVRFVQKCNHGQRYHACYKQSWW